MTAHDDSRPLTPEEMRSLDVGEFFTRETSTVKVLDAMLEGRLDERQAAQLLTPYPTLARALSDSALLLDAPSGGLCKGRYRATRSQVCDDTRMRCRGALGLYAPVLRPNIGMRWSLCRSEGVYLADWCVRMRWRCTTLRLTGMVSL